MDFGEEMNEFWSKCKNWVGSNNEKGIMFLACDASGEKVKHCVCQAGGQDLVFFALSQILNDKPNGEDSKPFTLLFRSALMYIAKEGTDESFVELVDMELLEALINRADKIVQKLKSNETESDG